MFKKFGFAVTVLCLACAACAPRGLPLVNMPNPASVYCKEHGGTLDIRTNAGGEYGVCIFPNGSECEEWSFYRGECSPSSPTSQPAGAAMNGWKTYHNDAMGFSFQYPADARIRLDETGANVFVEGPVVDNNSWPSFVVSFPKDRPDYQVPANADLHQWLTDHNLYMDQPQPDSTIAGTTAVHTRYPRGQQSFAADHFFFVHDGQLYVITIGHSGDKEDWNLYNQFLQSFKFD